jgi:uncharacterized protein
MSKNLHNIAESLREIGAIQITDTDFMGLMRKDISDLELTKSLRKLGSCQVMDWDFKDVLPAVSKLAHKDVDVAGFLKRTADYKVMEWDFRGMLHSGNDRRLPDPVEMQALILKLKNFLEFTSTNLICEAHHAEIKVSEIKPGVLNFILVMTHRDAARFIGREGHTAAAVRNVMKSVAAKEGVYVLLKIHTNEEDAALRPS